jgi:IS6 family transposase
MLKLMRRVRRVRPVLPPRSAFTGFRFPREVIVLAVRWYLRYGLSYRDVEELLAERGITVDHVTIYRWVQRFTPLLIDARSRRSLVRRRNLCQGRRAVGVSVSGDRPVRPGHRCVGVGEADLAATRWFFIRALDHGRCPSEVTTDRAATYPRVIEELFPAACHVTEQYANNVVEADHGRRKARLRRRCAA